MPKKIEKKPISSDISNEFFLSKIRELFNKKNEKIILSLMSIDKDHESAITKLLNIIMHYYIGSILELDYDKCDVNIINKDKPLSHTNDDHGEILNLLIENIDPYFLEDYTIYDF